MSISSLSSTAHLISRTLTPGQRRSRGSRGPLGTPGWALPFPSPKQSGEARPRLGKTVEHPAPGEASRGRLPSPSRLGKRAAPPAAEPGTRRPATMARPPHTLQPRPSPRPGPARGPALPRAAAAAAGRAPAAPDSCGSGLRRGQRGPRPGPRAAEAAGARAAVASAPGSSPGPPSRPPSRHGAAAGGSAGEGKRRAWRAGRRVRQLPPPLSGQPAPRGTRRPGRTSGGRSAAAGQENPHTPPTASAAQLLRPRPLARKASHWPDVSLGVVTFPAG